MPDTIDDVEEHPIIFNDWSINRILAGEKTQTRRVADQDFRMQQAERINRCSDYTFDFIFEDDTGMLRKCPYGQPGDVLWVREAFRLPLSHEKFSPNEWLDFSTAYNRKYVADGGHKFKGSPIADSEDCWGRKRPSIHMPRELCRIRLRVKDVRVERVQEITNQDAGAEGCVPEVLEGGEVSHTIPLKQKFRQKWSDIHGDDAWERNDWVWVVEFSQINE